MAQLRSAPAGQIVTELLSGLLNAAQIKLGRRDARLLIDLASLLLEHARPHLPADLVKQVEQALHQLRLAQVQAERAVAESPQAEPNDLAETPTPPSGAAAPQPSPTPPPQPQPSPASRLFLPGRDF